MFKKVFIGLFVFLLMSCFCAKGIAANDTGEVISNKYFSFTMPNDTKGMYVADKTNDSIYIIEKISEKLGAGGLAFGFKVYKNPKDHVGFDGYKKIGELTDKSGALYDVIFIRPDEIRYGEGETIAKNYQKLYNLGKSIEIKGVNGCVYHKYQGSRGAYTYGTFLKKVNKEAKQNWSSSYYKNAGFAYYDINSDGIDELFVGDMKKGNIYDVYAMVNRKPLRIASGYNNLFICNDRFLCANIERANNEKSFLVYSLNQNAKDLHLYIEYMYSKNRSKSKPWFKTYTGGKYYESISKEEYTKGKAAYNDYNKLNYTPLSKIK